MVSRGNQVVREITISNVGDGDLHVTAAELSPFSSQDFSLSQDDLDSLPWTIGPGEQRPLHVHYAPSDDQADEGAVFVHSDDPDQPQAGALLRARRKAMPSRLECLPEELDFGSVGVGAVAERQVNCRNVGGQPFQILSATIVEGEAAGFGISQANQFPIQLERGGAASITVTFSPGGPGPVEGVVRIESDALASSSADISLSGAGVEEAQPCITLSPASLNFGGVHRGDSAVRTFQVISCGVVPLTVTGIERGQFFGAPLTDEFQITSAPAFPMVLQPGERFEVEITYTPGVAGIDAGFFEILNDSPTPRARLEVNAVGLQPPLEDVALHVRLSWSSDGCDVDLHLVAPGGQFFSCDTDCHFRSREPDWGVEGDWHDDPFLDVDNIEGFGPENINLESPQPGVYRVIVHYWRDNYEDGPSTETDATIEIFNHGNPIGQWTQHLVTDDWTWEVADIEFPGAVVTPLGRVYDYDRSNMPSCPIFGGR